jgi:hypothetical protein
LTLVLPREAFLEAAGIVLLASGISARKAAGKKTQLSPEDPQGDALRYLQGIDFFDALGVTLAESFTRQPPDSRFVPIRRIDDPRAARAAADATGDLLEKQLPTASPSVLRSARFVFEELGVNIVQHSGAPQTGFGIAQAYPEKGRFQIAFADSGVGFRSSLARNAELQGRVADDAIAIQLAVEQGLSGIGGSQRSNMGIGLSLLRELSDLVHGNLWIASGTALWHRHTVAGRRVSSIQSIDPWDGAWVCLDAPVQPTG